MYIIKKDDTVNDLINITKSNSGISGPELAKAHIELGMKLAEAFSNLDPNDTTVVAVMRGGLFFAEGMYFKLGCKFQVYNPKTDKFVRPSTKNVIIVDSVINTGKTIKELLDSDMFVACCVINQKAVPQFEDQLYTIRVSENSFVGTDIKKQSGSKGPDTTMRLFNLI